MNATPSHSVPNTTCGQPRQDAFHMFRNLQADFPSVGTFARTILGCFWFWCANQVFIQHFGIGAPQRSNVAIE